MDPATIAGAIGAFFTGISAIFSLKKKKNIEHDVRSAVWDTFSMLEKIKIASPHLYNEQLEKKIDCMLDKQVDALLFIEETRFNKPNFGALFWGVIFATIVMVIWFILPFTGVWLVITLIMFGTLALALVVSGLDACFNPNPKK